MPPPQTRQNTTITRRITVLVSSRCSDKITIGKKKHKLTEFREQLKKELQKVTLLGPERDMFKVWINEHEGASEQTNHVWEKCMKKVREADIVLVLYNGNAGWAREDDKSSIGICHAELEHALTRSPQKVRIVGVGGPLEKTGDDEAGRRNRLFQDYVKRQELSVAQPDESRDTMELCREAIFSAVLEMTHLGVRAVSRGVYPWGDSLRWSEMNFQTRSAKMVSVLCDELRSRHGTGRKGHVFLPFRGQSVLFLCHAVPASMSIAAAREMLGQPFLDDYKCAKLLGEEHVGPVHIIACHRSVTEPQAIKQLGFPDATVVTPPFGVYVADNVQKIQLVFIANCHDETATREGVQRFFAWLSQTDDEGKLLAKRAASRRRIVKAIADEAP